MFRLANEKSNNSWTFSDSDVENDDSDVEMTDIPPGGTASIDMDPMQAFSIFLQFSKLPTSNFGLAFSMDNGEPTFILFPKKEVVMEQHMNKQIDAFEQALKEYQFKVPKVQRGMFQGQLPRDLREIEHELKSMRKHERVPFVGFTNIIYNLHKSKSHPELLAAAKECQQQLKEQPQFVPSVTI